MKHLLFIFLFFLSPALQGLALSSEAQKEAQVYEDFARAVFASKQGDKRAFAYYQKVLAAQPDSKYLKRLLVSTALAEGDVAAADPYADYIEQGENTADDLTVYAGYLWKKGEIGKSIEYYERSLAKNPDDVNVLYQYVLALTYIDVDKAVEKLNQHKGNYPMIRHIVDAEIGHIYLRKNELEEALKYYNASTKRDPEFQPPYLGRAGIYEKQGKYFLMLHELETLEKLGYQSPEVFAQMATVFVLVNDLPRAEKYFLKAKDLDNGNLAAAHFLATFAEHRGEYQQAINYLKDATDYTSNPSRWVQVSFYLQRLGQRKQAIRLLKDAYKRFDRSLEVGYFYAVALIDDGQYRRAARMLEDILNVSSSYQSARLAYAFALEGLKKYDEMEEQVHLLLEQDPANSGAYNLLGFSLTDRNIRLDEAKNYVTRALALNPKDNSYIDSMAWVYYREGEYQKALNLLESLTYELVVSTPDIAYHLGAVYKALGDDLRAEFYLRQASGALKEAKKMHREVVNRLKQRDFGLLQTAQ